MRYWLPIVIPIGIDLLSLIIDGNLPLNILSKLWKQKKEIIYGNLAIQDLVVQDIWSIKNGSSPITAHGVVGER